MLNVFSAVRRASNPPFGLSRKGASLRKQGRLVARPGAFFKPLRETTHIETVLCHLYGHGSKVWLESVKLVTCKF